MKVRQSENQNKGVQVAKSKEKWFRWQLHVLVNANCFAEGAGIAMEVHRVGFPQENLHTCGVSSTNAGSTSFSTHQIVWRTGMLDFQQSY